jgi:hypothetical protein
MELTYNLKPTGITFSLEEHFPILTEGKKIGIFLSGGVESSLLSLISFNLYGKENVVCFFSDNIFSANDPIRNSYIHTNIKKSEKLLDIKPIYLNFDYNIFLNNRKKFIEEEFQKISKEYNIEFLLMGLTELFFEVEIFKQDNMNESLAKEIAYSDPKKFKSTIEEFHLDTDEYTWELLNIDIPAEVYKLLRENSNFIRSPFKILNKCEIIDLYRQIDALDILYKTTSCIRETITETGKHCGKCFNCQNRYDAFRILNLDDLTEYVSDEIIKRREKLETNRKEIKCL